MILHLLLPLFFLNKTINKIKKKNYHKSYSIKFILSPFCSHEIFISYSRAIYVQNHFHPQNNNRQRENEKKKFNKLQIYYSQLVLALVCWYINDSSCLFRSFARFLFYFVNHNFAPFSFKAEMINEQITKLQFLSFWLVIWFVLIF